LKNNVVFVQGELIEEIIRKIEEVGKTYKVLEILTHGELDVLIICKEGVGQVIDVHFGETSSGLGISVTPEGLSLII